MTSLKGAMITYYAIPLLLLSLPSYYGDPIDTLVQSSNRNGQHQFKANVVPYISGLDSFRTFSLPSDDPNCFNCLLPAFECHNFANCSTYSGKCMCPPGFGGDDCSQPLCDSLADGDKRHPRTGDQCQCSDGWDGINCNVCTRDEACNPLVIGNENGTCYKGTNVVKKNFLQCDVTNKGIVDLLKEKQPQVTVSCNRTASECDFEFWIDQKESFYCQLSHCDYIQENSYARNVSKYKCDGIKCKCVPGRMLCGEQNSIDLSDWMADPDDGPKGPGQISCYEDNTAPGSARMCRFEEPNMNKLIADFFGDPYIILNCHSGECIHHSELPGYERPSPGQGFSPLVIAMLTVGGVGLIVVVFGSVMYVGRHGDKGNSGYVLVDNGNGGAEPGERDATTDASRRHNLMSNHVPCTLMFRDVSYVIDSKVRPGILSIGSSIQPSPRASAATNTALADRVGSTPGSNDDRMVVLEGVQGIVKPGQVLAIMGGSGAGKTTFLDILARRNKAGIVGGEILVNGYLISIDEYKDIIGYVDQEESLMETLTVYETILYSALLRLPRYMSYDAKRQRVYETMLELDILSIANSRVGGKGVRGISGGEKRRVSIACELVTSPSILFLDEPTSGLDSYNAYNVIECLVALARNYQRTVVFTIHQPRSNIYALFDQLVLLAKGKTVYSGPAQDLVIDHFSSLGFDCPLGFNIADYLVDLTMHAVETISNQEDVKNSTLQNREAIVSFDNTPEALSARSKQRKSTIRARQEETLFTPHPRSSMFSKREVLTSGIFKSGLSRVDDGNGIPPQLQAPPEKNRSEDDELDSHLNELLDEEWGAGNAIRNRASSSSSHASKGKPMNRRTRLNNAEQPSSSPLLSSSAPAGVGILSEAALAGRESLSSLRARRHASANGSSVISDHLKLLVDGYASSNTARDVRNEIEALVSAVDTDESRRALTGQNGRYLRGDIANMFGIGSSQPSPITPVHVPSAISANVLPHPIAQRPSAIPQPQNPVQKVFTKLFPDNTTGASWWDQFLILSGRTFKNLYRNPLLLRLQYMLSVGLAIVLGLMYWKLGYDLPSFQNRMGLFFFVCVVFALACLSSMQLFASERLIFMRERANGYYSPITYFSSKILFDLIPLRVVPPILLGLIVYQMAGLRADSPEYVLKFLLTLVAFNATAAAACLAISIIVPDLASASLVATVVILFEMLFGGLLLNKPSIPVYLGWLNTFSYFNCALEALVVNEVNGLKLFDDKFGLMIDVPGAIILKEFGFDSQGFWPDIQRLGIIFGVLTVLSFIWLQVFVKERR
ncbi:hypothetical protein SeMB42_g01127 [Synchytrium endobioticum]|uniref:ABC transporter domain-containing protein n=1 Tax=Synchytrium endobioticum TaxID=286115 RepID=A0A507DNS1_9FUNG|nr:hypothetical protein SeLEV6574_g04987 [Synchytrium endobioticum]TPX52895.1 hypothetical protein SeMB42_g01127 [Synchytrium endobioticum]